MATPSFDPYNSNGKIPTGRTGVKGIQAELYARARSSVVSGVTKTLRGHSKISAFGKTLETSVVTASARYPMGMITYTYYLAGEFAPGYPAGYYPDSPTPDQTGKAAFIDVDDVQVEGTPPPGWPPGVPYYVWVPGPEPDSNDAQKNESRIIIDLGEWQDDLGASRKSAFHLAAGGAGTWTSVAYTSPKYFHRWFWSVNSNYDMYGTASIELSIPGNEYIEIDGTEFPVPDSTDISRDFTATFTIENDYDTYGSPLKAKCQIDINGDTSGIDIPVANITAFPAISWQALADAYGDAGVWSKTLVASAKLGTKGLYFNVPEIYTYGSTNNDISVTGDTASVSSAGGGNSSKPYSGSISWAYPPIAYQFIGNARDIAGNAISPDVTYQESYADNEWQGDSSPVYRFSGEWTVNITTIDSTLGNYSDTGSADYLSFTEISTGYWQVRWYRDEKPVADLNFSLNVTLGLGETYPYFTHTDDYKLWIKYPRSRDALTLSTDTSDIVIDDFSTWTGINCTVTANPSGGIDVSSIGSNARIKRVFAGSKWFYPHRWLTIEGSKSGGAFDGIIEVDDVGLGHNDPSLGTPNNSVYEYTGGTKKRFSSYSEDAGIIWFDTYAPDTGRDLNDTVQSLFEQIKPLDTGTWSGTNLRWSWGIGKISEISISLTEGSSYSFTGMNAVAGRTGESINDILHVHVPVCEPVRFNAGDSSVSTGIYRIINSRRWVELATMRAADFANASGYQFTSVDEMLSDYRLPASGDYSEPIFTVSSDLAAWSSAWWDAVNNLYLSESVLFNKDYTPSLWIDPYINTLASSVRLPDSATVMKARPIYNNVTLHWFYGDGSSSTSECLKIYFGNNYMSLANGLLLKNGKTPEKQSPALSSFTATVNAEDRETADEGVASDAYGNFKAVQPLIYKSHQVKLTFDGNMVATGYTEDYMDNRERYRFVIDSSLVNATLHSICTFQPLNRTYLLYTDSSNQVKLRIYDGSAASNTERNLNIPIGSITVLWGKIPALQIAYSLSGSIYTVESVNEGISWSTAVSIATGDNPQIAYNPVDGVEMCAYTRSGKAYIKRKISGTWDAEVEVASVQDSSIAAIVPLLNSKTGAWILAIRNTSGDIIRYISTDTGRSWTIG